MTMKGLQRNKWFKSDSAGVAFLLCVSISGYGGMRRHRLTRRLQLLLTHFIYHSSLAGYSPISKKDL